MNSETQNPPAVARPETIAEAQARQLADAERHWRRRLERQAAAREWLTDAILANGGRIEP